MGAVSTFQSLEYVNVKTRISGAAEFEPNPAPLKPFRTSKPQLPVNLPDAQK
jgi:hypothetical protein